jgi:arsenate reductase
MGTVPAEKPEPIVVEAMMQDGMDITDARPKLIDPQTASRADLIVTMGCDVQGVPRVDEDWGLPEKA